MVIRSRHLLVLLAVSVPACGGETASGTASATPTGMGGAPGTGGSSAGAATVGGSGGSSAGTGATGGAATGGDNAGGAAVGTGGMTTTGGGAGATAGGTGGNGGMCPDFQAGFAGGPAMPELAPEGPSCAGGLTCAGRSCCESIRMKGGLLHLGTDCSETCDPDSRCPAYAEETPETDVTITPYALDTFPVTVGRFRKFVAAYTGAPISDGAGADTSALPLVNTLSGWHSMYNKHLLPDADALRASLKCEEQQRPGAAMWTDTPGPNENKPINCVDWFHAFAFCIWDGGWLPIEATWEYAAAGGDEDRLYPWGQPPPDASRVPNSCLGGTPAPCDATMLPDVGSFPAGGGKWGHLDLTGYLGQWVQHAKHPYGVVPSLPSCHQPECFVFVNNADQDDVVVRGLGTSADRAWPPPSVNYAWVGLRCARH